MKKAKRGRPRGIEALAKGAEKRSSPIDVSEPIAATQTAAAQARLDAAVSSVNNLPLNLELARAVDRDIKQKALRGLSETHVDLLRTAIVFAGAGLDATLKELIRSTIRDVWTRSDLAREKFADFVAAHLAPAGAQQVSVARLARLLASPAGAQDESLRQYELDLTGGSLQSAQQVSVVCSAVGVQARELRQRLKDGGVLDQMFRARNQIIHELDLRGGDTVGWTARGSSQRKLWA